jgi:hypothetical protein
VRYYRKYWFPILGLIILSLGLFVACGKPGYIVYKNDKMGYAISYPYNWQVEFSEDQTKVYMKSPAGRGTVMIRVAGPISAKVAAGYLIAEVAERTSSKEVTQFENKPMQDFWDWYLAYDWEAEYGMYHGEAYFKQTEKHIYMVDTGADKTSYENYHFDSIISTFKLLGK